MHLTVNEVLELLLTTARDHPTWTNPTRPGERSCSYSQVAPRDLGRPTHRCLFGQLMHEHLGVDDRVLRFLDTAGAFDGPVDGAHALVMLGHLAPEPPSDSRRYDGLRHLQSRADRTLHDDGITTDLPVRQPTWSTLIPAIEAELDRLTDPSLDPTT